MMNGSTCEGAVLLFPSVSSSRANADDETAPDSFSDDCLYHILLLAGPRASATLGLTCSYGYGKVFSSLVTSSRVWKVFATQRWGKACAQLVSDADSSDPAATGRSSNAGEEDDAPSSSSASSWYGYYRKRCSSFPNRPKQISHLDLIQEHYASDPYRLLTVCILCSRTSGGYLVRTTAGQFLEKYPTPTSVLEEEDMDAMAKLLHPLGLNRERTMKRFVHDFLGPWTDVKDLHGCGLFAKASFDVFCRGDYKTVLKDKKADRNVKAYAAFVRRLLANGGDEEAEAMEEAEAKEEERKRKAKEAKKRKPPRDRSKPIQTKKKQRAGTRKSPRNSKK